jgi:hypothetical protein
MGGGGLRLGVVFQGLLVSILLLLFGGVQGGSAMMEI